MQGSDSACHNSYELTSPNFRLLVLKQALCCEKIPPLAPFSHPIAALAKQKLAWENEPPESAPCMELVWRKRLILVPNDE